MSVVIYTKNIIMNLLAIVLGTDVNYYFRYDKRFENFYRKKLIN